MQIAVLCATRRGYLFLQKLTELLPASQPIVFSFAEEPWEPPFLSDIRRLTLARGGEFLESKNVGSRALVSFWQSRPVDLMFVVSWRYLIPPAVYRRARLGAFVFHDSLLPAYRGFSPTVWAIVNGEERTGVTLFEIAERVDEGAIVDQQTVSISQTESIGAVMDRVTGAYLEILERNLVGLTTGAAPRLPQDHAKASYTCKRLPDDNRIDWSLPCKQIYNLIRAVSEPYPGAYAYLSGRRLRVWEARRLPEPRHFVGSIPGRVVEVRPGEGSVVLTRDEPILLTRVQLEDDKVVCASEILNSLGQTLT